MKIDYMGKYVLYAIKAGKMDEFFFENDPENGFGLTTGVTKPDSSELIRLHFGAGQNFPKTMEYVERALIADDDYFNGYESKDEHYRALLALWYKLTDLKSGTKGENLDNQMPEPGTIDERIQLLTCEYYMRSGAKASHIDREARREKMSVCDN